MVMGDVGVEVQVRNLVTDPGGRRVATAIMAAMSVVVAVLTTGCVVDDDDADSADDSAAWRMSTDPVPTGGLAWAAGSTVHLSDGTTIDAGGLISAFVIAGDGVFFVPAEREWDAGSPNHGVQELKFGAPGRPPIDTGLMVSTSSHFLFASPGGRYLAVLDVTTGEKDRYGTPQPFVVAFDLETGEQTIDSTLGMGDPDEEDYAASEMEIGLSLATDESLYVQTMDGNFVFVLATGEARRLRGSGPSDPGRDFFSDVLISPDDEWRIKRGTAGQVRVLGTNGEEMTPRIDGPRWNLSWWVDDRTVVGTYETGDSTTPDSAALMSCRVPTGKCKVFEDSVGNAVVFPLGVGRVNADGRVRLAAPILQGR